MSGHPAAGNEDPRPVIRGRWPEAGRAILAILGFYAVVIVAAGLLGVVTPVVVGKGQGMLPVIAGQSMIAAGSTVFASTLWAVAKWRRFRDQGWPGLAPGLKGFARGLGFGVLMAAVVLGAETAVGGIQIERTGQPVSAYLAFAPLMIWWLALAALGEELVFRGFPLSRLAETTGPVAAAVILTIGFSGFHLLNPGASALGLVNVALASLVLSAAFLGWGGLPASWGLHLGWNAGLALLADAPVSGINFGVPGFRYVRAGPDWLSGGAFGPEGGLVASCVMVCAIVLLGRRTLVPLSAPGTGDRAEGGVAA